MSRKKVLLLNPPGDKIYFRDYYCSKVSKASYYYHPLDLLYLSGRFSKQDFDLDILDAIADNLSEDLCLAKIKKISPDIILSLVASPSYQKDISFLKRLKEKIPNFTLIVTGDVYRGLKQKAFQTTPFIDAILLDFSTDDVIRYIKNGNGEKINNIIYKIKDKIIIGNEIHGPGEFDAPVPRWDLFHIDKYSFPFARRRKFATILTDFGCPFSCSFCPINTLGFKLRPLNSVIEELKILKSLGVNELFIRDQTFGVNKKRTIELCEKIIKEQFNFSWTCFSRVDVVNESLLALMKKAGCHTVMFGIESSNEDILKNYKKNISLDQIKQAINLCKKFKIRTVGTFIIGLPGETRKSTLRTIDFAESLDLDYASFNIAAPLFGAQFRKQVVDKGWVDENNIEMESAKGKPIWKNQQLSNEEILQLHKKAIWSFYLRPKYLLKRLFSLKTIEEIKQTIKETKSLFKK